MGGLSLVLSLSFYLKSRAVRKLPKTLTADVFDRTFNVFNPFSQAKRTYSSYVFFLIFSPLVAFAWTFILVFVVFMQILEAGLLLGLVLFILSLGFMMTDEAYEMHQNASILEKAVKNGAHLGRGDIAVLSIVKKTLWKMSVYYLFLSLIFLGSFFAMPQVLPQFFSAFVYFIGIIGSISGLTNILAPIVTSFLIALSTVAIFLVARRIKAKSRAKPIVWAHFSTLGYTLLLVSHHPVRLLQSVAPLLVIGSPTRVRIRFSNLTPTN